MAKIILLCGKICSGKSTYSNIIRKSYNAVILSCDDLMLKLFDEQLGENHSAILEKTKSYLYQLAEQIIETGTNVILDFGFWTCSERQNIRLYFAEKGIETEMHYVKVSPEMWLTNVEKRNIAVKSGLNKSYYIDENMKQLFQAKFQEPSEDEIDILYETLIK